MKVKLLSDLLVLALVYLLLPHALVICRNMLTHIFRLDRDQSGESCFVVSKTTDNISKSLGELIEPLIRSQTFSMELFAALSALVHE